MNSNYQVEEIVATGNDDLRMDGLEQYMAEVGEVAGKGTRVLEALQQKRKGLEEVLEVEVGDAKKLRELRHRFKAEMVQLEQRERDILSRKEKEMKMISANKQKLEVFHNYTAAVEKEFQNKVSQFEKWSAGFLDQFMNMKLRPEMTEVEVTELKVEDLTSHLKALELESGMLQRREGNDHEDLVNSLEQLERSLDTLLKTLRQKVQEERKEVDDLARKASSF